MMAQDDNRRQVRQCASCYCLVVTLIGAGQGKTLAVAVVASLAALLLLCLLSKGRTLAQTSANPAPPQAVKNTTAVEKTIPTPPPDELEEHFRKARESFLKKDASAAAAEIRKGALLLKLKAGHATEKAKEALTASSHELERLTQGIEKVTVTSTRDLRRAFARADRALAEQHYQKAAESWSKKEIKKAGHELKAAANHVEMAVAWADHKLDSTTAAVIKDARAVSAKLTEKAGWTKDEVVKGLDSMGKQIENLTKHI